MLWPRFSRLVFRNWLLLISLVALLLGFGPLVLAQNDRPTSTDPASGTSQSTDAKQSDPLKRPLTEKQKKQNAKSLHQELSS
jgi:hypothetical protein